MLAYCHYPFVQNEGTIEESIAWAVYEMEILDE